MASFPRWLDKARATGAKLISYEPDGVPASQRRRKRDAEYADIPPFLLPLSVRVRLDKDRRNTRSRAAPYDKTVVPVSHPVDFSLVLTRSARLVVIVAARPGRGDRECDREREES